ncbi:unnamed protein product [Musa textilis]
MIEEFDAYGAHVSNCLGLHTPHVGTKQPLGSVHWILLSLSLLHLLVPCWRKTRRLHMAPVVTGGLSLSSLFLTHLCNLGLLHLSAFYPPMYLDSFPNNSCPGFTSRCSSCRCSFLPPSRIAFLGPKRKKARKKGDVWTQRFIDLFLALLDLVLIWLRVRGCKAGIGR